MPSSKSKLHRLLTDISLVFCIFENPKNKYLCTIYFIIYWTALNLFQIQGIWCRLDLAKRILLSITIIEMCFRILLFLTNFLASLDLLFFKSEKLNEISGILEKFEDSHSKFHAEVAHRRQRFLVLTMSILVFIIFSGVSNFVENQGRFGDLASKAFGPLLLLALQTAILIANICFKLGDIGKCIKILNREMYQTMMHSYPWVIIRNGNAKKRQFFGFIHTYDKLFRALTLANDVYSFHFLMLLVSTTTMILHICNMLVKYTGDMLTVALNIWKMVSIFGLVITYTIFVVLLTYTCDDVVKQEKNTLDLAYKLLINFRGQLGDEEQCIKEYLRLFAEQIHGRNFRFTACGLFNVDLTALFMILGSIAMYLIIIPIDF